MKPLTEKILKSGLVDQAMADILEKMGVLPPGASELAQGTDLANATKEALVRLADDLGDLVEKEYGRSKIRETHLDLRLLKWPARVDIRKGTSGALVAEGLDAVVDSVGRYYFRHSESEVEWFSPGHVLSHGSKSLVVVECQALYTDETPVCYQVRAE